MEIRRERGREWVSEGRPLRLMRMSWRRERGDVKYRLLDERGRKCLLLYSLPLSSVTVSWWSPFKISLLTCFLGEKDYYKFYLLLHNSIFLIVVLLWVRTKGGRKTTSSLMFFGKRRVKFVSLHFSPKTKSVFEKENKERTRVRKMRQDTFSYYTPRSFWVWGKLMQIWQTEREIPSFPLLFSILPLSSLPLIFTCSW